MIAAKITRSKQSCRRQEKQNVVYHNTTRTIARVRGSHTVLVTNILRGLTYEVRSATLLKGDSEADHSLRV